jgi:hypothetical protein
LYLSIALILGLTLFVGPVLAHNQQVFEPLALTDTSLAITYDLLVGPLLMLGAIGLVTVLWLRFGFETPKMLSIRQFVPSVIALAVVAYFVSDAITWNMMYGSLNLDAVTWYQSTMIQYGTAMFAMLVTAGLLKRWYIQGDNPVAGWARRKTTLAVPIRAARTLTPMRTSSAPA